MPVGDIPNISNLAGSMGCKVQNLPTTYLGLPLGDSYRSKLKWNKIIERVEAGLPSWKSKDLSKGGKLTLINSVLCSLPIYYFSIFEAPMSVIHKIERIIRNFLWDGDNDKKRYHLVDWLEVAIPKELGGLGIKQLHLMNVALLMKWLWKLGSDINPLWKQLIFEKYEYGQLDWYTKSCNQPYGCSIWKGINKHVEKFKANCSFALGDGRRISFWNDKWIGEIPLAILFPAAYNASNSKRNTVNQMYSSNSNSWILGITRRVQDHVIREIASLLHTLDSNGAIPSDDADVRLWKDGQNTGEFSVKKCYNWLIKENLDQDHNLLSCVHPKKLWSKLWPAKVSFFMWSASKHKILTQDQLSKRHWRPWANHCYMCIKDEETPSHLLLHCQLAIHIWDYFRVEFELIWTIPPSVNVALSTWPSPASKTRKSLVIKALPAAILWSLWKERNRRAFNNKTLTHAKVILRIKHTIAYWLYLQPVFQNIPLRDFMLNWKNVVFEPP